MMLHSLLNYMNSNILCSVAAQYYNYERSVIMIKTDKTIETLTKELSSLDNAELHDLFMFYYRINHQHANLTSFDNFNAFLMSFDKNPFRRNEDKDFKKQLIDNLIAYTDDHMSLITAIVLLKRKFTVSEIIENYYCNVDAFDNDLF